MTQPALNFFRRRAIAAAIQAVAGTPETVNPATHGFRMYDGRSGIEVDENPDNPDRPFFSGEDFAASNERAFVEGEIRLIPPSAPGDPTNGIPEVDVVLRAAGMARTLNAGARTTRYTPISQDFKMVTAHWWQSGLFKEIFDARGLLNEIMLEIDRRARATARLQGYIDDLEEDDVEAVTVPSSVGPVMSAANSRQRLRVDGGTWLHVWSKMLGIQPNGQLQSDQYTEKRENSIDDRVAAWTSTIARTALADFNPRNVRLNGNIIEIQTRLYSSNGLYVELGIRGKVRTYAEAEIGAQKFGWELGGPCLPTSSGNDEFYIEFGDSVFAINGTLDDGVESTPYDAGGVLTLSGEYEGPVTYDISAGTLPTGLTLNGATGLPEGTPTAAGTYTFTIRATDSTAGTPKVATKEFEVEITA